MEGKSYLVGITGGSASGKTHFLKSLRELFSEDELCIISQDNYYKKPGLHEKDENGEINFDRPACLDLQQVSLDIENLHGEKVVYREEYLFERIEEKPKILEFKSAPIIACEGLFIFHHPDIFKQLDLKIFIHADENIAFERRLKRDTAERNISEDFVRYQWKNHVMPAYREYLLPYMAHADIIINNNMHLDNSLKVIENHFRMPLNKE